MRNKGALSLIVWDKRCRIVQNVAGYIASFVVCLLLLALAACANTPKAVNHAFSFGSRGDNQGIEVLNYRYGSDSKLMPTSPPDWALATGHIGQTTSMTGTFPPGDFLYVKWRIESTGAQYEDTVDLKSRLPSNIADQRIHFVIKGPQLYVYLISEQLHAAGAPDCPVKTHHIFKCTTLYPERQANF